MKKYAVYGVDTITPQKEFDNLEEAKCFARKNLRKWGRYIKDTETKQYVYRVHKNSGGIIVEKNYQ